MVPHRRTAPGFNTHFQLQKEFSLSPVEIHSSHGAVIMRARNSELLILQQHVTELREKRDPKEFSKYFLDTALVNRPARKLFQAWARKDQSVWPRLFRAIQESEPHEEGEAAKSEDESTKKSDTKSSKD